MRIHQRYRHGNSASTVCSMIDCQINQWRERRSKLKQKHFSPPRRSSRKKNQTKGLLHRLIANPTHWQVDGWMDVSIWSLSDRVSLKEEEEEKENAKPSMTIRRELLEQPRGIRNLCSIPLIDGFEQNFFFLLFFFFIWLRKATSKNMFLRRDIHTSTKNRSSPTVPFEQMCRSRAEDSSWSSGEKTAQLSSRSADTSMSNKPDIYVEEWNSSRTRTCKMRERSFIRRIDWRRGRRRALKQWGMRRVRRESMFTSQTHW